MKTMKEQIKEIKGTLVYRGVVDSIPDNGKSGDVHVLQDTKGDSVIVCVGSNNWVKVEGEECLLGLSML